MNTQDNFYEKRPKNKVIFRVIRAKDGSIWEAEATNTRTNLGINQQAVIMGDPAAGVDTSDSNTAMVHMGISEWTATPASGDTNLHLEESADGLSRLTGTYSHTADQSSYTLTGTWQYTGSSVKTIASDGIHSRITDDDGVADGSRDTLFVHTLVSPVAVLNSNDTLEIQHGIFY